ncbi:MAG TPA: iron ABC transporter permease [Spongiibacteraceae bacterium]|nr:iron ABC transporter permease [Spongiibacteraceae bacterium]
MRAPLAKNIRDKKLLTLLAMVLLALLLFALARGPVALHWWNALQQPSASIDGVILWQVRLPRVVLAILVGASLGIGGAALQGLLRNPLAGPDLLGVSSCAALGAVLTLYTGVAALTWIALPLGGIAGALLAVFLIFFLAGRHAAVLTLILAGIAVNAVMSSFIALVLNFAPNPFALSEMMYWLLGSLANRSLNDIAIAMPFMLAGWLLLLSCGRFLDALSLGEETAQTLGFNAAALRWRIVIGVALCVGAAVAVSGNIGFVGLVVPHLLRPWVGYEPRRLLVPSALGGAILLLLSDIVVQSLSIGGNLKLGVVTALLGGPFFLHLIFKQRGALQ